MKFSFPEQEYFEKFERGIHILILLNVVAFTLETIEELKDFFFIFSIFEYLSIFVFMAEYGIRIYFANKKGRAWNYIFSFMGLIDLITILPVFLTGYINLDLRFTKLLRFFQILRIFKIYRHSEHLQTVAAVLIIKRKDLFATLLATFLIITFCAFVVYFFEKDVQPHKFSNMLMSFYWAIETLTTTGYGDIYPITLGGRMVASVLALVGIGLLAIPAAILSAGFVEVQAEKDKNKNKKRDEIEEAFEKYLKGGNKPLQ